MPTAPFGDILRYLYRACAIQGACDQTDRELLERFLTQREEKAFIVLVERHGRMVFSVARRVLGDSHDAEDVFQATFLVLARRTRQIGGNNSIGGWLHGVAQNIALKARAKKAVSRMRERAVGKMEAERSADPLTCRELRSALDEEIGRLAEKYRTPIVLCYLEGRSYEQAARELGCSKMTLSRLLTKARDLLKRRLERRGITLAAGTLATALTESAIGSPVPALLTIKTVKAATLFATGKVSFTSL